MTPPPHQWHRPKVLESSRTLSIHCIQAIRKITLATYSKHVQRHFSPLSQLLLWLASLLVQLPPAKACFHPSFLSGQFSTQQSKYPSWCIRLCHSSLGHFSMMSHVLQRNNPDKIWPVASDLLSYSLPLICPLPAVPVPLLLSEWQATLPQRSFILAVSSVWILSLRYLQGRSSFFLLCVCMCMSKEVSLSPSGLCSDITFSVRPSLTCYFRS